MVSPVKEFSSAARSAQETAETTLAEMRDSVTAPKNPRITETVP